MPSGLSRGYGGSSGRTVDAIDKAVPQPNIFRCPNRHPACIPNLEDAPVQLPSHQHCIQG